MYISIFSDELGLEFTEAIPYFKEWKLKYVDFRGKVFGKSFEKLNKDEVKEVKKILDNNGLRVGCFESSIGKVHLPENEEVIKEQQRKLDNLIVAAEILDCRLVRCFHFWQPEENKKGTLSVDSPELERVLELTVPIAKKAAEEGITAAFENCGVTVTEVKTVLDSLKMENCSYAWDVHNNWDIELKKHGDPTAYIREYAPKAKLVHMKSRRALPELNAPLVPWDFVFSELKAAGYNGLISVETHCPSEMKMNPGEIEINRRLVKMAFELLSKI